MRTDAIAHRHLLAVDGLQRSLQCEGQSIRIVVAEHWASSVAGQLLTSCLVNLLCRQVKLLRHIEVVAPETPALIKLPCGDSANYFPACLETLAAWTVNGAVSVTTLETANVVDFTVFVGEAHEEEYLSGVQCGGLGEAALRDYVVRPPAEFSAGFVSLGSGILLTSALLRNTIFSVNSSARGDMTTLNFLNGGLGDSWLGADDNCQLSCQVRRIEKNSAMNRQ